MKIRKVYVLITSIMFLAGTTPFVLAATSDTLVISFDPEGDIDIDVSHATHNYSTIQANTWDNTSGEVFTLYNNGTLPMDTEVRADNISTQGDMRLNTSVAVPGTDEYAIYIEDLDVPGYLNQSYLTDFDTNLEASGSKSFDVCLLLGTNISANHSWQEVNISFRGSIT